MDDNALQNIQSNMDDLESEIVGQVNEKKFDARKEKFQSILGDTKLQLSEGTDLVKKGMQVFDQVREAEACLVMKLGTRKPETRGVKTRTRKTKPDPNPKR